MSLTVVVTLLLTDDEVTVLGPQSLREQIQAQTQKCLFPRQVPQLTRDHPDSIVTAALKNSIEILNRFPNF